jgi:hypothetical protein
MQNGEKHTWQVPVCSGLFAGAICRFIKRPNVGFNVRVRGGQLEVITEQNLITTKSSGITQSSQYH